MQGRGEERSVSVGDFQPIERAPFAACISSTAEKNEKEGREAGGKMSYAPSHLNKKGKEVGRVCLNCTRYQRPERPRFPSRKEKKGSIV